MRVVTVLGTRPEIIRLSRVIEKLDRLCEHTLVHTGQNYDPNLNDIFFRDLGVRKPDVVLSPTSSSSSEVGQGPSTSTTTSTTRTAAWAEQISGIIAGIEPILADVRPDRLLILGDTNSGLAAFVAKRMGIPVYHMEAGNRCYDDRVPEEVNRRVIDHSSDVLMPYTERSRANLLHEGIAGERIYVTGNPIREVIEHFAPQTERSTALADLQVEKGKYFLVTLHRAENVDAEPRLRALTTALDRLQKEYALPIICSLHPRTRSKMEAFGFREDNAQIRWMPPLGFFDFIALEKNAFCVLSDSGTVQEECCLFQVANVTLRDVTERPETLECGSNMLSGADPDQIALCVKTVLDQRTSWSAPPEYLAQQVSDTVIKILLGYRRPPAGAW